jgi:ferredoxin-type protein NapF
VSAGSGRIDASRRRLLRGYAGERPAAVRKPRLPWLDTGAFHERCTRCGDCARACPEGIVAPGDGGFPHIDFARGGCTFCGACADACSEALFSHREGAPWRLRVAIGAGCLARTGVVCESCRDGCDTRAIRFTPAPGRVPAPVLDLERCTGCGACVGVCPVSAIGWVDGNGSGRTGRDVA